MKKTFSFIAAVAVAAMAFVACNNNKAAEENTDTTPIEQIAEEEINEVAEAIDTVATAVVEETKTVAKKAAQTTVKKAEEKAVTTASENIETPAAANSAKTPVTDEQKANRKKRVIK